MKSIANAPVLTFLVLLLCRSVTQALTEDQVAAADLAAHFDKGVQEKVKSLGQLSGSIVEEIGCSDFEEEAKQAIIQYFTKTNTVTLNSADHFDALTADLIFINAMGIPDFQAKQQKFLNAFKSLSELLRNDLYMYYSTGTADNLKRPLPSELSEILASDESTDQVKEFVTPILSQLSKIAIDELKIACSSESAERLNLIMRDAGVE